jgi:hypothetical protein
MKRTPIKRRTPLKWKECEDSPTGRHVFTKDWEYDPSGKTVNCEYCGELKPTLKPRKRINPVSNKRRIEERQYSAKAKHFLINRPFCEVEDCHNKAVQVHHKARRGRFFLDESTWLAVCQECHEKIEHNPKWAIENGYLCSEEEKRKLREQ